MRRVGLLGGAFDPPHEGHLRAAEAVRDTLGVDEMRLLVSAAPPHKQPSPFPDRVAMAVLAVEGRGLAVSAFEGTLTGTTYTADVLRALVSVEPPEGLAGCEVLFAVGADAFAGMGSWREPGECLRLARFVAVARSGYRPPEGCAVVDVALPEVSSSLLRQRMAARRPVDGLVPAAVERYASERLLYR